jgi:hypothetical protein
MIHLTEEEIQMLSRPEAEEKLLYVRYLLRRAHRIDLVKRYKLYSALLERRITALNMIAGSANIPAEET